MRRFNRWMGFILAALFTVLVACSQPVEELEFVDKDEQYLSAVRDAYPVTAGIPDADLISLAKNTCKLLGYGKTGEDIMLIAMESGMEPGLAGFIAGAGTYTYCPEYQDQLSIP